MYKYYDDHYRHDDPFRDYDWDNDGYPGEFIYGDDIYMDDYYTDERWKPIKGFEFEYYISDYGRVWSIKNEKFLKIKPLDRHGHLGVCLYKNGRRYYKYIHRLVAEAFIPNPNKHNLVRHIYDDPSCNTVEDLLWGTHRDNHYDAVRNGRVYVITTQDREKANADRKTPIEATNLQTGEILYFESQGDASRVLCIPQANIWKVLVNERRHAGGYTFRYCNRGDANGIY